MQTFTYTIKDEIGLHARPAGLLVKEAKKYESTVTLSANGKSTQATKLMAIMGMCIKCGTEVAFEIEGADEEVCAAALKDFLENNV